MTQKQSAARRLKVTSEQEHQRKNKYTSGTQKQSAARRLKVTSLTEHQRKNKYTSGTHLLRWHHLSHNPTIYSPTVAFNQI